MQTNQTTIKTIKKIRLDGLQSKRKEAKFKPWARDDKQTRFVVKSDYFNK